MSVQIFQNKSVLTNDYKNEETDTRQVNVY